MRVTSTGVVDGAIMERYGAKGSEFIEGMPSLSIPFEIVDAPEGTVSFAVILEDYDAVPVCGFDWIHWILCDLKRTSVSEGESRGSDDFTEGCNSWHGIGDVLSRETATGYGGMAPPDKTHRYTLSVYALDCELGLGKGFFLNELMFGMEGHVLDHAHLVGTYEPTG